MIQGQDTMIIRIVKGQNALTARILAGLFCMFALGCEKKSPTWDGQTLRAGQAETTQFGTPNSGFIEWLDPTATHAAFYQFREDTDGDGAIDASLGDHGAPLRDKPKAYVANRSEAPL